MDHVTRANRASKCLAFLQGLLRPYTTSMMSLECEMVPGYVATRLLDLPWQQISCSCLNYRCSHCSMYSHCCGVGYL